MKYITATIMFLILSGNILAANTTQKQFPPRPPWQPSFSISPEQVLERMVYYLDDKVDIAVFENGTVVILPDGLALPEAQKYAYQTLSNIYSAHPDFKPSTMDDGNIVISYNYPAYNVVINSFAEKHFDIIEKKHLDALTTSEVLITPLGKNKSNPFSMKALYGRTFMFMDAQNPKIIKIYRHKTTENQ